MIDTLLRDLAPQVLGAILRRYRDFSAAEDAVQEALLAAAAQWPREGLPDHPRAWLIQVASRRFTDQIRANSARRRREAEFQTPQSSLEQQDDTLQLLFLCCHPALTPSSAIALTLRAIGGLTTTQIANAFLVPESTMAQRISRAKQTIKASDLPFQQGQRLREVQHILYLIFNEGYTASTGQQLQRTDLATEAIRLTRLLMNLVPNDQEAASLLALMLLTDARKQARATLTGDLIPLTQQDRSLWNRAQIDEGTTILTHALGAGKIGPYQLQAAIAALHDEAATAEATDWPQILALYVLLERMSDNPLITLNRAIATAMVHGPAEGLALLSTLDNDPRMTQHRRLAATRAHLLERLGDHQSALIQYNRAAALTSSLPERNYLLTQAAQLPTG